MVGNVFAQGQTKSNTQKPAAVSQANTKVQAQQPAAVSQPQGQQAEVRTIFSYKKELALTDNQEQDLKDVLTKFQNYLVEKRKELTALSTELSNMIKNKVNLKQIRAKIDSISRVQADASYSDVETSRKVEGVLTKDQMANWKKIQEEFQRDVVAKAQAAQAKK